MNGQSQPPTCCPECAAAIRSCTRLQGHLETGAIRFEEFAYNAALSLLEACDTCPRLYLSSLPDATAMLFGRYLQATMDSHGDIPFIHPFVVDLGSKEEFLRRRQAIAPKVVQLCRAIEARVSSVQPHRPS